MMPWERDVYVTLLRQYIEEENLKAQQRKYNGISGKSITLKSEVWCRKGKEKGKKSKLSMK